MLDEQAVARLVDDQIAAIGDVALLELIGMLRVGPYAVSRDWDYGDPGQKYVCWTVLEHPESNTGVAYCEQGFGPSAPWGLVCLHGPDLGMGMDCGWFTCLEDAVRSSMAWEGENPAGYEVR